MPLTAALHVNLFRFLLFTSYCFFPIMVSRQHARNNPRGLVAGEMAQVVKCLPCKPEDLPCFKRASVSLLLHNTSTGEA